MPLQVGEVVNDASEYFLSMPVFAWVANNPAATGFTITFIIMLILLVVLRNIETEESLMILILRAGFFTFLATTGILLLHNRVLELDRANATQDNSMSAAFEYSGAGQNIIATGNTAYTTQPLYTTQIAPTDLPLKPMPMYSF